MLTMEESQQLIEKLIELRNKANESNSVIDRKILKKHEKVCIEKFKYLVTMKTGRYKSFSNYDDLNQEGFEALLKALKNYDPKKGSWFYWAHKYISTRISRSANLHTTIRYPLKIAKENVPHKENIMPILIETKHCPDTQVETSQISEAVNTAVSNLPEFHRNIIRMAFGLNGEKTLSINRICNKLNITRCNCIKIINSTLLTIKESIKI